MEISVLMSIYNKEKPEYFKQALESIVNQTLQPKQIVIIKDGKLGDELEAVLQDFKGRYSELIDIYALGKNGGLGESLRFGVHECKCEYIARMDTDDIALPDRFMQQTQVLEENPELDILGGFIEEYDENMEKMISVRKVPLTRGRNCKIHENAESV